MIRLYINVQTFLYGAKNYINFQYQSNTVADCSLMGWVIVYKIIF